MKYVVNDGCIGCGMCEATCPEVFSMTAEGVAKAIEEKKKADKKKAEEEAKRKAEEEKRKAEEKKANTVNESVGIRAGSNMAAVDKFLTGRASDGDVKGSTFAPLKVKSTKQTKTSIKLKWKKAKGAKKYVVYANQCGKKNKVKKIAVVKKLTFNIKKINGKKLKKGTYHKFIVVAFNSKNKAVATSKYVHVATKGNKKNSNPKKVVVKAKVDKKGKKLKKWKKTSAVAVKKGKKTALKAQIIKAKKTKVKKHVAVRFESSNAKIVKVNKKGKITGVKKGKAKIFAYAQSGICKTIKVTVK